MSSKDNKSFGDIAFDIVSLCYGQPVALSASIDDKDNTLQFVTSPIPDEECIQRILSSPSTFSESDLLQSVMRDEEDPRVLVFTCFEHVKPQNRFFLPIEVVRFMFGIDVQCDNKNVRIRSTVRRDALFPLLWDWYVTIDVTPDGHTTWTMSQKHAELSDVPTDHLCDIARYSSCVIRNLVKLRHNVPSSMPPSDRQAYFHATVHKRVIDPENVDFDMLPHFVTLYCVTDIMAARDPIHFGRNGFGDGWHVASWMPSVGFRLLNLARKRLRVATARAAAKDFKSAVIGGIAAILQTHDGSARSSDVPTLDGGVGCDMDDDDY